MFALVVYTTLTIAGFFMLIMKHERKGASYREDAGDYPVVASWLAAIMSGALGWWVLASVPWTWASTLLLVNLMLANGVILARAYATDGVYTKRLWGTLFGAAVSGVTLFGLWSALLG